MRKTLFILSLLMAPMQVLLAGYPFQGQESGAQAGQQAGVQTETQRGKSTTRTITGVVQDKEKNIPLGYALLEVFRKKDQGGAGRVYTDSLGKFNIRTEENGELIVRISLTGYQPFSMSIDGGVGAIELPVVYLTRDVKQLGAVTVSGRKPLVRQEVDRLTYDVQSDPESKSSTLIDMMRKVPYLSVDADDNVKLKNSGSYKVLIDGKESALVTGDPKNLFKSMAADNVQRIEVITTPPAKYDGEGLAGIINIITAKKLHNNGYSGSVGVNYKFPNGPWTSGNFNLKAGKFGLSAFGGVTKYDVPSTGFTFTQQSTTGVPLNIVQEGQAHSKTDKEYLSTQASYEIDDLNLLSVNLAYNRNAGDKYSRFYSSVLNDTIAQSYWLDNTGHTIADGYDLGLDYQLGFRKNKGRFLNLSYKYSYNKSHQENGLRSFEKVNYQDSDYTQDNKAGTKEHTVQLDYVQPFKNLQLEAGGKAIMRNNFSDYTVTDLDSLGNGSFNAAQSNQFTYQQNVYSLYNSYQVSAGKWVFKAGVRMERTTVDANFMHGAAMFSPDYTNWLPSVAIQDKFSGSSSINFGFADRIKRPGIQQLNPFVDRQNPLFITYGNPGLRPEVNHVLSLNYSYSKKVSLNLGVGYSFSNNTIQAVSTLDTGGVTSMTFANLGRNRNWEGDVNMNLPLSAHLNLSINGQINFMQLAGTIDGVQYSRNATAGNANIYAGYRWGKDWRAGFTFLYFSPNITLQGTSSSYYYTSLSFSKGILKNRLVFSGSVSNPYLQYLNYKNKIVDSRFVQNTANDIVYRRFNLGVNFKFGKLKDGSIRKNNKGIRNDDIKVVPSPIPAN